MRPWQLIRRAPRPVWIITALFALVLAAWSVLAPLYHAADEPNHADAVMRLVEGKGWPSSETARVTDQGVGATAASPYGTRQRPLTLNTAPLAASAAPGRDDRPTWKQLQALPGTSGRLTQQITQHPPGYYWYEAVILKIGGATGWRWDIAVSAMRLLSALLVVWLPLLSWATAWRMTGSKLAGIAASIVPLAVPELTHVGSSVNNDNLVTLAGAATLLGVACVLRGDRSRSTALWIGGWLAIALWAKAFGLVLVPLVIGVYALAWFLERRREAPDRGRSAAVALALSAGVGIALGCWWYVVNEVRYGSTQPGVPGFPPGTNLGNDHAALARYLSQGVLTRWWGSLGWFEVTLPWRLVIVATIAVGALGIVALLKGRRRRLSLLLLLWPTVLTYALVFASTVHYYHSTHHIRGLAGRYLFIGFTGVAALVGIGCAGLPARLARWTPLALLIGALGMQAEAAHLAINKWWRPAGGTLRQAWDALSAWSTWPVGVLWAGVAALVLLVLLALATTLVVGLRSPDDAPSDASTDTPAEPPAPSADPSDDAERAAQPVPTPGSA
jgi:small subunit ribosomal protein S36